MRKSKQDRESRKNINYLLLKITSPAGKNIIEEEDCKNLLDELSSYITNRGGSFYQENSIVLLEGRDLIELRVPNARYIRIPTKWVKSGRIKPYFKYDVVMFQSTEQDYTRYFNSVSIKDLNYDY